MRRFILLLFLFSLLTSHAFGHRENSYFLLGRFGEQKVAVVIDEYGDACMSRYFTPDDRYDHIMEGVILEDNWFELYSYTWDQNKNEMLKENRLLLKEVETDRWEGTWKSRDGVEQVAQLKRMVIDSLNHPYFDIIQHYHISPYSAYRIRDVKFEKVKKEKISKGAAIVHVIDPKSGIGFFRVLPNKKMLTQVDSINQRLIAEHLNAINAKYSCVYLGAIGDYLRDYKVDFLNQYLLSYRLIYHSACYGGPGEDLVDHHTLSIPATQELILEDLFWLGEKPQVKLSEGEYQWTQYRYKVFSPKVISMIQSLYPEKFLAEKEDHCRYDNLKLWYFPGWYLTREGLFLLSTSALTSNQCEPVPQALIPYVNLKKYAVNDFGLIK
ncbi:MAG: hypothetical protein ACERKD_22745 [Prolixibacteraceae bacterium]